MVALRVFRLSPLTLLATLSGLITLILVGLLFFMLAAKNAHQDGPSSALPGNAYITLAQTASGVHPDGSPIDSRDDFAVGQTVYIAYMLTDAGPGTVIIKAYQNGALFDSASHYFAERSTYNAYFKLTAKQAGEWEADLYWRVPGAGGAGTLEQKVTFLVGETSLHGNGLPISLADV